MNSSTGKVAVLGAGISGLSVSRMLKERQIPVTVYEAKRCVGGLVSCQDTPAGLYHKVGGHVFNTKSPSVNEWFWKHFRQDTEFRKIRRNAQILLTNQLVAYPIENNIYKLPQETGEKIVGEILQLMQEKRQQSVYHSLQEYCLQTFGQTLYSLYFEPYNKKIWQQPLEKIPLDWLEGKLPMPTPADIIISNVFRRDESAMVHASFFYPLENGSQFVADRFAKGLDIRSGVGFILPEWRGDHWVVLDECFEKLIFTGDIRTIGRSLPGITLPSSFQRVENLRTRGISNAFCICDATEVSWLYIPNPSFKANRIIYTGNFSVSNSRPGTMTCVVEFPFGTTDAEMLADLSKLPGNLRLIQRNDAEDAYIIHGETTRKDIAVIKAHLLQFNCLLLGRFAEWEYYNIDAAIGSAMNLVAENF